MTSSHPTVKFLINFDQALINQHLSWDDDDDDEEIK